MKANEVIDIVGYLQGRGIRLWVDGGWGVDALLGIQTRPHADLDLAVELADRPLYEAAVAERGYAFMYEDGPMNWVVEDGNGRQLDVHLVDTSVELVDDDGGRIYGGIPYPVGCFEATGTINGVVVPCCTADFQMVSHTGYAIADTDRSDVMAIHRRFGIPLPDIYRTDLPDHQAFRRNGLAMLISMLLLVAAGFALSDNFGRWLAEVVPGMPKGCGADGWESAPSLLLLYAATGAVVWVRRHPSRFKSERFATSAALIGLSVLVVLGTFVWLLVTGGWGCVMD